MFRDIQKVVFKILEEDERARNDDKHLICKVLEEKGLSTDLKKINGKISLESITRARRMVQATNPKLRANKETQKLRDELREEILVNVLDKGAANG